MKISKMASVIEPSLTRKLFNLAKQYNDVVDLTLGDPDVQPLDQIKKAACDAIITGKTRYSANAGLPELRQKIGDCLTAEYGIQADPFSEIIVTVGGMEALFLTFAALIDEGDEVIIPAPYYVNYVQMVRMCGGIPVLVNTYEKDGFQMTEQQLREAVTEKTVAIVLNSPGNPSGITIDSKMLDAVAEIAQEHDLVVISDEVYRTLLYDGRMHDSIITRSGMQERTVLIDSISKRFSMTGYRVGYAIGPAELIASMTKMQENVCACAPLPSQYAAIEAYSSCTEAEDIRNIFEKRRDFLVSALNEIEGLHCFKPAGTFYLFVNISESGMNCVDFAYALLEKQHVAIVPAVAYGEAYSDYIRIAFTLEIDKLREAAKRIADFMAQIQKNQ